MRKKIATKIKGLNVKINQQGTLHHGQIMFNVVKIFAWKLGGMLLLGLFFLLRFNYYY
jgi:hypothetical protein